MNPDQFLLKPQMSNKPYELIAERPRTIYFVECTAEMLSKIGPNAVFDAMFNDYPNCEFRGVPMEALGTVLESGIDVHPVDGVIWAGPPDKAAEYCGWPGVILALKQHALRRTFKTLPASASNEELEAARREFPTLLGMEDGSTHCTKLAGTDGRLASGYETAYAWWIPGDPSKAIAAIFLLGALQHKLALQRLLTEDAATNTLRTACA